MNYERLKTFIAVSEKKSFSEAAKILYVTQPTITAQIKALEEELNTKLFERSTKKVEITQSAAILLKYAKEVVRLTDTVHKEIEEFEGSLNGELNIGCSMTIGEYILPESLKQLKNRYPLVRMRVDIANSNQIVAKLKDQLADVGLIETPVDDPQIILEPFLEDELILIAAPDYFSGSEIKITLDQLKHTPFIVREKGSGTRAVVNTLLKEKGIALNDLHVVMELGSTEAIKAAVESGLGVSIISKNAIKKELQLKLLKSFTIRNLPLYRSFYIAIRKDQVLKTTVDVFMEELRNMKKESERCTLIQLPASI